MHRLSRCASLFALLALAAPAGAHKPGDSILVLGVEGRTIDGRWSIALRDLEHAIGLDADADDAITWGELKSRRQEIESYALTRLGLASAGAACPVASVEHLVDRLSDGTYAVLRFEAECPADIEALDLSYDLLFDLDALHRGLVQVDFADLSRTAVLSPERRRWTASARDPGLFRQWLVYVEQGMRKIGAGFDRILSLL